MEMRNPTEFIGLYFTYISIIVKTIVGVNIELGYSYMIGFFYWFKKCTGISGFSRFFF